MLDNSTRNVLRVKVIDLIKLKKALIGKLFKKEKKNKISLAGRNNIDKLNSFHLHG